MTQKEVPVNDQAGTPAPDAPLDDVLARSGPRSEPDPVADDTPPASEADALDEDEMLLEEVSLESGQMKPDTDTQGASTGDAAFDDRGPGPRQQGRG